MGASRKRIRSFCLGGTALAGAFALMATPASAQQERFELDLPSQRLDTALRAFARESRQQLMFAEADTKGFNAPALSGAYSADEALQTLLAGTSLEVRRMPSGVFLIGAASDPQGGSAAGGGADVDALIVTAQKREENIQDVPIAISAFSQEDLTTHQIAGGPDLITQVPNMTFTKTNFSSYSIQIRGIGTQAISATTDPGVAVAFNNTPFIQNRFFEQEFYDLQRVEVLRGPQGTLYGRNATAGVVNIISAKPKFIAEAKLSGDVANYNSTRLEGMVNIPLVEDVVAVRLAGAWTKREGFVTNEITGNPIDGRDLWSTRLSLRFAPTDALDVNLIWEHFEEKDDRLRSGKQLCKKHTVTDVGGVPVLTFDQRLTTAGLNQEWIAVQPRFSQGCIRESLYSPNSFQTPNGASVPYYVPLQGIGLNATFFDPYASQVQSQDLRVIESTVDPDYRATADLGELQISWDIGDSLTVSSETAYATDVVWSKQDFNRFNTVSGAWNDNYLGEPPGSGVQGPTIKDVIDENGVFCDPQIGCSDRLVAVDLSTAKATQFSQEFRIASDFTGPFNFSLGANFTRFDLEAKYYVFINSLTLTTATAGRSSFTQAFPYIPGVSDNSQCFYDGLLPGDPDGDATYDCVYIEPNSIENIQDQGHNYFLSKNPYKLISYAVFGEAYYNITDALKVTAGLRWTVDKKEAPRIPSWTLSGYTRGYPVLEVIDQEWREPTGRLTLDWKPDLAFTDETLLYASYAHGYKAGGVNPPPYIPTGSAAEHFGGVSPSKLRPKTFEPEFIDAFEFGAKNTLADGRVTLNLAAFYYDYRDYQISEIVDRSAYNKNYDATIWGLEIEADWRPLENLRLGFKGGYENTRIADGESAIDLMDRTAGDPNWIVIRPFPTFPSSCIVPTALVTHRGTLSGVELDANPFNQIWDLGQGGGAATGGCEYAYFANRDPVTNLPYEAWPDEIGSGGSSDHWALGEGNPGAYPGWDPSTAPNHGEGIAKDIGGNPLPNAPAFTATITADYTVPLPNEWLVTLHTDLYWQSESNWRIFDDHEYNKLDEYFTMNLAAIFTNEEAGWRVMAYIKNVFDRDSITGAFLNSDDTGLTTNVFLTEPRLYGVRVTKEWNGGPLLGSFGARREGPYPLEVEIGGQVQRHDAENAALAPGFLSEFSEALSPLADQQDDLDWGDGREVKVTYRPGEAWKASLGVRFGKTNGAMLWSTRSEVGDEFCPTFLFACQLPPGTLYFFEYDQRHNYTISDTVDREEHTLVDFAVGKDIGLGALEAGLRYADFGSTTQAHIFGTTNWNVPDSSKYPGYATRDRFEGDFSADREFKGAGPVLSWAASKSLLGNSAIGVLGLDWQLSGGVLFGKRKAEITGDEVQQYFYEYTPAEFHNPGAHLPDVTTDLPPTRISRSESVTVPTFGVSLGLSYSVDRFRIGTGYRWETYQGAIDGGFTATQEEDRTIDGPYFKVSVGFGG